MKYILSPSMLAADVTALGPEIKKIGNAGAEYVHLDVMDGTFVPNISYGVPVISGLRKCVDRFFDVHLMVQEPKHLIPAFARAGADLISVHVEACENVEETLAAISYEGVLPAIAMNPATPVEKVLPYLDQVKMVLVMTVIPGKGGQTIIRETFPKVAKLREIVKERGLDVDIEADGGITLENVHEVLGAGANIVVAGTSVFRGDAAENVKSFYKEFSNFNKKTEQ